MTIKKKYIDTERQFGGVPYGNVTTLEFVMDTVSGIVSNSDGASAIATSEVVKLGLLPAGFRILEATVIISAALTASTGCKVGYVYADGDAADNDYINAALTVTAGRTGIVNTASIPVELPKDAYLIFTNGSSAAQATTGKMTVIVQGILRGDK